MNNESISNQQKDEAIEGENIIKLSDQILSHVEDFDDEYIAR